MHLRTLSVVHFKNIREAAVDFSPRLNAFIGNNGAGKTNFLDALYALSFSKSFFNPSDQMSVTHGESWFMLQGRYEGESGEEQVVYAYRNGEKKQLRRNGKAYRKLADHIGRFPLVMVSPSDASLILGGSEERRKFIDGVISQYNPAYLDDLLRYNRVLLQRNTLLKQMAPVGHPGHGNPPNGNSPNGSPDHGSSAHGPSGSGSSGHSPADHGHSGQVASAHGNSAYGLLDVYDGELVRAGESLYRLRKEFIRELKPVFQSFYTTISGGHEEVGLHYHSDLNSHDFEQLLKETLPADRAAQFTTAGIHKDDLRLTLDGHSLKKTGSQGQQKTYLVALKLAQFEFIRQTAGITPILLLDDIFDKLDSGRVEQIVRMVAGDRFGQIVITDTNRDHLDTILQKVTPDYRIFMVDQGKVEVLR